MRGACVLTEVSLVEEQQRVCGIRYGTWPCAISCSSSVYPYRWGTKRASVQRHHSIHLSLVDLVGRGDRDETAEV